MLDHINRTRRQHVVTIEDPIEILHADQECIVNQREVGLDTVSFGEALRRALRQDPDVILIGELRDAETAQIAAAGRRVRAPRALDAAHDRRGRDVRPRWSSSSRPTKQGVIRSILAGVLRGVVSQRLLPRVGGGRVVAVEVMVTNARIADLIREGRAEEIHDALADGDYLQMQTFLRRSIDLVLAGHVEARGGGGRRHEPARLPRRLEQRGQAAAGRRGRRQRAGRARRRPSRPSCARSGLRLVPAG